MIGGLALVREGLHPFDMMRRRLSDIRAGKERQLLGSYPTEVQPLVDDLNALLEHRDQTVRKALAKAGDLAHGLKTPLAVLAREAELAGGGPSRSGGDDGPAGRTHAAADRIPPRARPRRCVRCDAGHAVFGRRLSRRARAHAAASSCRARHHHRRPRRVRSPRSRSARRSRGNARQPARQRLPVGPIRVAFASPSTGAGVVITVDDDGPGLDASMRPVVLQRGVRADEAAPGSGLGLAIVRDLAELYGGSISLDGAPAGGPARAQASVAGLSARGHAIR